ncbi:MAG: hypothetical protein K9L70_09320, partial [Thiohalocapsa sp.]|nr:hypothetical protein [Thiohalocapsa sp.]
ELWNVRITGGGSDSTITYAGLITSSATLQTEGFSLEGNDVLDSTPGDGTVDYDLKAIRGGQDGFALRFADGASVCFDPTTLPAGAVVKVGASGQTLSGAFDLQTLEACDGAPPPSDPSCSLEPSAISTSASQAASLQVTNNTSIPIERFWINYGGNRVSYGFVQPGATATIGTFVSHPWVFADDQGRCLKLVTVEQSSVSVSVP